VTNEEYVRRVVRIEKRIDAMFPYPEGDWDSNQYAWEECVRRRKRASRRIYDLPNRWRKVP
jgi:hypothetical protein